jgi:multiple sugar transport system permease protein
MAEELSFTTVRKKRNPLICYRKYLSIAPLVLFILITLGYPLIANIIYSFSNVTFRTIRNPVIIGFQNYLEVLTSKAFWGSFLFSFKFAILSTLFEISLGLMLAIALAPLLERFKILLTFMLLPLMIAPVLMGIMYRLLLNEFVGIIPQYLQLLGINVSLLNPPWITRTLIGIEVLQWTPFAFLIIFSALQSISEDIIEAAKIDGASGFKIFHYITLPALMPSIVIATFIRFVDSFRVFDHIYVLTGGGPGRSTTSLSIYIYKAFFQQEQIGSAVAAAMILLLIFLIPLIISMKKIVRN